MSHFLILARHILYEMFDWPGGNVLGNLLASMIWGIPSLWHLHRKIDRNHQEIKGKGNS